MKKSKILSKIKTKDGYIGGKTSYEDIVRMCFSGVDWFFEEYEGYDSGDFFMLGKDKNKNFYFFTISYGSCSGCDWLQAVQTKKEFGELIDEIFKTVVIKKKQEMIKFLEKFDYNDFLYDDLRVEKKLRRSILLDT